jgi:hypothetical protein
MGEQAMTRVTHSREVDEVLSRLAEVDRELQRYESNEQSIERGLEPLRLRLEQMSVELERRCCAEDTTSSVDEVGRCRYRELLEELEEKSAIARSKRRLAQRERRVLEIRRSRILTAIPREILLGYGGLVKATVG